MRKFWFTQLFQDGEFVGGGQDPRFRTREAMGFASEELSEEIGEMTSIRDDGAGYVEATFDGSLKVAFWMSDCHADAKLCCQVVSEL